MTFALGGSQDEHLAHQIGLLLVAAHEADHPLAGSVFDDSYEALAHDLLKLHALLDDRGAAPAVKQRLLDAREAAAQHAHDQVLLVVGLRTGGPAPVELLQQRDHALDVVAPK
jgi:hypothetical protein